MPNADTDATFKPVDRYAEYTFFANNTQTLADRRQSATQLYLGVNTTIFALIGFLLKDAGLQGQLALVALPLFFVGIIICLVWDRMICQYRSLIHWRFQQLMKMEEEMPGSYRMFTREWEDHFKPRDERAKIGFSALERHLPRIVLGLYILYGISFLIGKTLVS